MTVIKEFFLGKSLSANIFKRELSANQFLGDFSIASSSIQLR